MTVNCSEQSEVLQSNGGQIPKFAVGLNVFLEMEIQKMVSVRLQANVIGWKNNSVLITSAPTIKDNSFQISNGVKCIIRYIHSGSAFGFTTTLLEKHQQHTPMWLLDFPKSVETMPLRQDPRVDVFFPAKNPEDKNWNLLNLSYGGALIRMEGTNPAIGSHIKFSFSLPTGEKIEDLQAEIVRHNNGDENEGTVGVKFLEEQDEQIGEIRKYCDYYCKNHPKL